MNAVLWTHLSRASSASHRGTKRPHMARRPPKLYEDEDARYRPDRGCRLDLPVPIASINFVPPE